MITTIIFDMDDTLYDESDYCRSGFAAVAGFISEKLRVHSADIIFDALWKEFKSGNRTSTFNAALEALEIEYEADFIGELINFYRGHTPDIKLPAESEDVLGLLAEKYKLGLLTDGFLPAQQLKVKALGIERFFKAVIYTELLGREFWKPSPVGFQKIIEQLDSNASECVYIGDNLKKDFIAPNKLGFMTVQLIRPARIHRDPAPLPDAAAQHIIERITDLPVLLER